jgi:hypothetical protein
LSSYIHSICDGDSEGSNQYCSDDNGYEQLYNSSLADYNKKVSDGNLNYYFDGNQLYIVLSPASLAQNSGFNILFNVISKEIVIIES